MTEPNELFRAKIYGTNTPIEETLPVGLGEYSTEELMAELNERNDYTETLSPLDNWFNKYGIVATKGSQASAIIEIINLIKEEASALNSRNDIDDLTKRLLG